MKYALNSHGQLCSVYVAPLTGNYTCLSCAKPMTLNRNSFEFLHGETVCNVDRLAAAHLLQKQLTAEVRRGAVSYYLQCPGNQGVCGNNSVVKYTLPTDKAGVVTLNKGDFDLIIVCGKTSICQIGLDSQAQLPQEMPVLQFNASDILQFKPRLALNLASGDLCTDCGQELILGSQNNLHQLGSWGKILDISRLITG